MQSVNVHEAKTHFSKLLEQVQNGDEIIIAKAGQPIARLVAYKPIAQAVSCMGAMAGEIWMAEDFDLPLDDQFKCLTGQTP
ncbi:MAG: type II toxin-antitoxin system Phd/YefM family antitoxin [Chromatiaceae bacterium]